MYKTRVNVKLLITWWTLLYSQMFYYEIKDAKIT